MQNPLSLFAAALSICLALPGAGAAAVLSAADMAKLLAGLKVHREKFPSITADFSEEKTTRLLREPLRSAGTIAFTAPSSFRREVKGNNPSLTVCDGRQLWIYYPNFQEAELYTLGQRTFFDDSIAALTAGLNLDGLERFYRYEAAREGAGYKLVLRPRTPGLRRMLTELSVWITADFMIQRTEALLPKGERVATTYSNVRSKPVAASEFKFQPPPGVTVSTPLGK
jgi:outer membrane lipoprotein-sorting protein